MSRLADALFTTTQQNVLGLLHAQPDRSFYTNEILRATGMGVATIKRELDRMVGAGILQLTRIGNQHHYQANPDCPLYEELLAIVRKTFGMADLIRAALEPLSVQIVWVFIFGSMASGKETSGSDVDLIMIGSVSFPKAINALYPLQEKLAREINPKIYSPDEWTQLMNVKDGFVQEVLTNPRINVMGDGHEFG